MRADEQSSPPPRTSSEIDARSMRDRELACASGGCRVPRGSGRRPSALEAVHVRLRGPDDRALCDPTPKPKPIPDDPALCESSQPQRVTASLLHRLCGDCALCYRPLCGRGVRAVLVAWTGCRRRRVGVSCAKPRSFGPFEAACSRSSRRAACMAAGSSCP